MLPSSWLDGPSENSYANFYGLSSVRYFENWFPPSPLDWLYFFVIRNPPASYLHLLSNNLNHIEPGFENISIAFKTNLGLANSINYFLRFEEARKTQSEKPFEATPVLEKDKEIFVHWRSPSFPTVEAEKIQLRKWQRRGSFFFRLIHTYLPPYSSLLQFSCCPLLKYIFSLWQKRKHGKEVPHKHSGTTGDLTSLPSATTINIKWLKSQSNLTEHKEISNGKKEFSLYNPHGVSTLEGLKYESGRRDWSCLKCQVLQDVSHGVILFTAAYFNKKKM